MDVQEVEAEAAGVCATLGLPLPLSVAQREAPGKRLAAALLAALEQPERELPIPLTPSLQARPAAVCAHRHAGRRCRRVHRLAVQKGACAFHRASKQGSFSGAWCLKPGVRIPVQAAVPVWPRKGRDWPSSPLPLWGNRVINCSRAEGMCLLVKGAAVLTIWG